MVIVIASHFQHGNVPPINKQEADDAMQRPQEPSAGYVAQQEHTQYLPSFRSDLFPQVQVKSKGPTDTLFQIIVHANKSYLVLYSSSYFFFYLACSCSKRSK